jgi:sulfatase maturation enzyme AslB (radical SAM superfamily)
VAHRKRRQIGTALAVAWRMSTLCDGGECVNTAVPLHEFIDVGDSKNTDGPVLDFTADQWRAFVGGIKGGVFDPCSGSGRTTVVLSRPSTLRSNRPLRQLAQQVHSGCNLACPYCYVQKCADRGEHGQPA